MNSGAANVVCRSLGYARGVVGSSPCATYGGVDLCGAPGSPVAMKDLKCVGHEVDVGRCFKSLIVCDMRQRASLRKC